MRWTFLVSLPISTLLLTACGGYTLVRRSDLEERPSAVIDSSEVVALRQQVAALRAQCRADSIRLANSAGGRQASGNQDSIIRQKEAEIASLKEQLSKAQDELERIKRRLAIPTK
jgi:uncharacterized protein involved in exopolysaccharide biosynthesis